MLDLVLGPLRSEGEVGVSLCRGRALTARSLRDRAAPSTLGYSERGRSLASRRPAKEDPAPFPPFAPLRFSIEATIGQGWATRARRRRRARRGRAEPDAACTDAACTTNHQGHSSGSSNHQGHSSGSSIPQVTHPVHPTTRVTHPVHPSPRSLIRFIHPPVRKGAGLRRSPAGGCG